MEQEYYSSKHFTAEQMDQRLLQGYYDDAVEAGYQGTKDEFVDQWVRLVTALTNNEIGSLIEDGAITTTKIAGSSIVKGHIVDEAVTNSKIKDGTISIDKIAHSFKIALTTGAYLADGTLTPAQMSQLVVNDLTTGGADKALSAEMGKVLEGEVTELKSVKHDINGYPDLTVNATNATVLGKGFIKKDGNTILDETDQTTTRWGDRKVLKYDLSLYRCGKGEYKIKGTNTSGLLYYAITDKNNTILSSQEDNSGVLGRFFEGTLDIQEDAKYIYFCDDGTSNSSYVNLSKKGLYDNVEELQSKQAITENLVNGSILLIKGADTVTIDANNATILGRGYIKTDNGKVVDEVDNTSSNYQNRKVLKYNVSPYVGGTIQIKGKSDNGFLQYAIVDSDLNILSSHTSTRIGQIFQGTVDVPLDAFAIYIGDDYANNQAFAILTNAGLYKTIKDIQQQNDYSRYNLLEEWFTVRVNSTRPVSDETNDYDYNTDGETYYDDNCYIGFPDNVKADTKLIIMFHGGGEAVGTDAESMNAFNYSCAAKTYRALGYAVLMTNGMPDLWAQEKGLENSSAPIGNWMALESTIKAYQYVTERYPCIDQKGCYLWATSQGGMVAENFVELCDIPVRACCYQAPALSMRYAQLYLTFRLPWIQALYGFNSIETYSKDKCLGLDPFVRNVDTDIPIIGTTFGEIAQTDVDAITSKKFRKGVPLLILHGTADTAVSPVITKAYIKAINNAGGCMAKYKLFEGVGHGVASPTTQSYQGTTSYSMDGYSPTPLYTTAGILEFAKWYHRYGGYPIPSGVWGNAIQ